MNEQLGLTSDSTNNINRNDPNLTDSNDIPSQPMAEGEDADGGVNNNDIGPIIEETHVEEPIYFDQTTRHIGSIQKNMVLDERERSLLGR